MYISGDSHPVLAVMNISMLAFGKNQYLKHRLTVMLLICQVVRKSCGLKSQVRVTSWFLKIASKTR